MGIPKHVIHKYVDDARLLFKGLNGVFVVHKPAGNHFPAMRSTIIMNLCRDLNNMYVRPPSKHVAIEGPTNEPMKVIVRDSFADDTLVVGPRYQPQDFRLSCTKIMPGDSSGVTVCGINHGNSAIHSLRDATVTRFYKVKGLLGQATDNYFSTGKIVEKSTYKHVKRGHLDKVCSIMQSSHQRKMYELCGIDLGTQAAYDLAVKGLLRPADPNIPMLYTIKCIDFSPPEFTLEIVCINEYEMYLKTLIQDVGMKLQSTATCTQILCLQDGLFTLEHALLKKHWTLESILGNMSMCQKILMSNKNLLHQESPVLVDYNSEAKLTEHQKQLPE
ncbi:pseudouridylate synthase TRUB2, mitochondrial [Lasioglossum baleicum]|uniref:pseudouridylate synthase TRUB2, mitochondrial n=1 Tax=Lasioglossum baleicum TaxID=434251 RepID=UPI003FCE66FF